ncbi:hypothetical protein IPA_08830 [Ignicoccus pacificus DSM 13166]|uniref:Uncharacterized protein n=1 Tax=Ignicoccus pacificus DSM 13166 TaxID=940294 RepID=A0A977KCQ3_9CREN|nr:hypothetical protein IPA_08830 [Ignicoccus pacificus DSM 13166]
MLIPMLFLHFHGSLAYYLLANGTLCGPRCLALGDLMGVPYFGKLIVIPNGTEVLYLNYSLDIIRRIEIGSFYPYAFPWKRGLILCSSECLYWRNGKVLWKVNVGWTRAAALDKYLVVIGTVTYKVLDPRSGKVLLEGVLYNQMRTAASCGPYVAVGGFYKTAIIDVESGKVRVLNFAAKRYLGFDEGCKALAAVNRNVIKVFDVEGKLLFSTRVKWEAVTGTWKGEELVVADLRGGLHYLFKLK